MCFSLAKKFLTGDAAILDWGAKVQKHWIADGGCQLLVCQGGSAAKPAPFDKPVLLLCKLRCHWHCSCGSPLKVLDQRSILPWTIGACGCPGMFKDRVEYLEIQRLIYLRGCSTPEAINFEFWCIFFHNIDWGIQRGLGMTALTQKSLKFKVFLSLSCGRCLQLSY